MYLEQIFFEKYGLFSSDYQHGADIEVLNRLVNCGAIKYIAKPFLGRRLHEGQLTHVNKVAGFIAQDKAKAFSHAERQVKRSDQRSVIRFTF